MQYIWACYLNAKVLTIESVKARLYCLNKNEKSLL